MKKVLIPTKLDPVAKNLLEANGNYTVVQDDKTDIATLASQNPDAYALIVRSEKVTAAVIDAIPSSKLLSGQGPATIPSTLNMPGRKKSTS
jgi:phosphoglycerate dehydrogenase-like enzyme